MRWRRRLVRLHMANDAPSIEGVFCGYVAGHYRIKNAKLIRAQDQTEALEDEAWVPRDRVVFAQTVKT